MRYCPLPSVITDRTFSVSTGLDASTDTPGRTAPDASFTTPAIVACACCAYSTAGTKRTEVIITRALITRRMPTSLLCPAVSCQDRDAAPTRLCRLASQISHSEIGFSEWNTYTLVTLDCQGFGNRLML